MFKPSHLYIYSFVILLVLVSCNTNTDEILSISATPSKTVSIVSSPQPSATFFSGPTQTIEYKFTPTFSPTLTETPTLIPTASQTPTQTPTPAETPFPIAVITSGITNLRTGPGTVYPIIVSFVSGISLKIIGRSVDSTWLLVDFNFAQTGWISIDAVDISEDLSVFAPIEAPPTPILPTLTPTPSPFVVSIEKYEGSEKIILVWVKGLTQGENFTVDVISYGTVLISASGRAWAGNGSGNAYVDLSDLPSGTYTLVIRSESGLFAQTSWKISN